MPFIEDPENLNRVIDSERNRSLTRFNTDVAQDQRHYYFLIEGVNFRVKTKFSLSEATKTIGIEGNEEKVEASFLRSGGSHDPIFHQAVLPSLCEAIICLEERRLLRRHKAEGWKVSVNFMRNSVA